MNNHQNSLYGSSVRSYDRLDSPGKQRQSNFVKYLHTMEKLPMQDSQPYETTPIIIRNKSYDAFNSKIFDRPSKDNQPLSQRFYESIVNSSSQQKYINQVNNLQAEITKLMANELGLRTEKELLMKDIKRLKEEIAYLEEKCNSLENKNQELFKSQSKMSIIEREYSKLQLEHERQRNHCRMMHEHLGSEHITNLPTKIEHAYLAEDEQRGATENYRLKGREATSRVVSNRFSGRISPKVSWKKTSGAGVSPIYKLQNNRKYSGNRLEDVSLIESKIDKLRNYEYQREQEYYPDEVHRDQAKTIDLKDLQKIKEYDSNIRSLSSELKEVRIKNIALYRKGEEFEQQKMKLMQSLNEMSYEKTKMISDHRCEENEYRKEIEGLKLQLEDNQIKIMELNEVIAHRDEAVKLLTIEKSQIEEKIKKITLRQQKESEHEQQRRAVSDLKKTLQKSQRELTSLKERWVALNKKQESTEIQNKLHIHQLEQKMQLIAKLQAEIQNLKQQQKQHLNQFQKQIILEEESVLSKTQNKINDYKKSQDEIAKNKLVQTEPQSSKVNEQLHHLREIHLKLVNEHNLWGFQLNKLRNQQGFINENYHKLSQLYEQQKLENTRLKELNVEWRQIEAKTKAMKHIDLTVDHLWQIKQVEYSNIHQILEKINCQKP